MSLFFTVFWFYIMLTKSFTTINITLFFLYFQHFYGFIYFIQVFDSLISYFGITLEGKILVNFFPYVYAVVPTPVIEYIELFLNDLKCNISYRYLGLFLPFLLFSMDPFVHFYARMHFVINSVLQYALICDRASHLSQCLFFRIFLDIVTYYHPI